MATDVNLPMADCTKRKEVCLKLLNSAYKDLDAIQSIIVILTDNTDVDRLEGYVQEYLKNLAYKVGLSCSLAGLRKLIVAQSVHGQERGPQVHGLSPDCQGQEERDTVRDLSAGCDGEPEELPASDVIPVVEG